MIIWVQCILLYGCLQTQLFNLDSTDYLLRLGRYRIIFIKDVELMYTEIFHLSYKL